MKPTHPAFEADFKAFLDGELPFWRRSQVRRHLQNCPACREELRIMQVIEQELKTEDAAPLNANLRAKILDSAPVEVAKAAPKKSLRVTPQFVFAAGSTFVLAAIVMFPVFNRARENARRAAMQSNLKQIGTGIFQYNQDYDEKLAQSPSVNSAAGGAAPNAAPLSDLPSRARQGASINGDARSLDLSGVGNKMYLDGVVPAQRQVHRQGSLSVTVDDAEAKGSSVEILVKNVGGFIAQNALSTGGDGPKTVTLDVRVPVAQFEAVVAKIGKLGALREKSVNGEDITQRVTQAGAQKQSLARELSIREAQLREADPKKLAARRNIVADVRQLRFQANQARAQLEYLQKYAALATLFVTLQDKAKPAPVASSTGELKSTARMAWSSFLATAQWPIQLVIWILAYSPLWVPALILWRKFGRKMMSAS